MSDLLVDTNDEIESTLSIEEPDDIEDPVQGSMSFTQNPDPSSEEEREFQKLIDKGSREEATTSSSSSSCRREVTFGSTSSSSSSSKRRGDRNTDQNPRPIQRQRRVVETPLDRNLTGKHIMNTLPVKIQELLQENIDDTCDLS